MGNRKCGWSDMCWRESLIIGLACSILEYGIPNTHWWAALLIIGPSRYESPMKCIYSRGAIFPLGITFINTFFLFYINSLDYGKVAYVGGSMKLWWDLILAVPFWHIPMVYQPMGGMLYALGWLLLLSVCVANTDKVWMREIFAHSYNRRAAHVVCSSCSTVSMARRPACTYYYATTHCSQ